MRRELINERRQLRRIEKSLRPILFSGTRQRTRRQSKGKVCLHGGMARDLRGPNIEIEAIDLAANEPDELVRAARVVIVELDEQIAEFRIM